MTTSLKSGPVISAGSRALGKTSALAKTSGKTPGKTMTEEAVEVGVDQAVGSIATKLYGTGGFIFWFNIVVLMV
ncbi:hypothetical protein L1987_15575 [Smallanthus sonchifolius]|uniref:Uncharacterized protein n=1 Tax=Smallanthus sonchifolius TaxID=185202 RepID=A0ACB9J9F1_9ASTR|nr:hypothetical protein L1987_15575 [Smallanthus sonchifolius]